MPCYDIHKLLYKEGLIIETYLSDRIRDIRRKNKLTQKELAQKTGLSIASIQGYEQGKYKPKIEQLQKIAIALNSSLYDLMQHVSNIDYNDQELSDLKDALLNDSRTMLQYRDILMMDPYHQLNEKGQDKAIELIELLTKIPEYKKSSQEIENSIPFLASYDWPAEPESSINNSDLLSSNANQTQKIQKHNTNITNNNKESKK